MTGVLLSKLPNSVDISGLHCFQSLRETSSKLSEYLIELGSLRWEENKTNTKYLAHLPVLF